MAVKCILQYIYICMIINLSGDDNNDDDGVRVCVCVLQFTVGGRFIYTHIFVHVYK